MKIKYQIELLSDWQCGSGLDSGTDADTLVIKNKDNLPYIPGKTIKGLLRDSLHDIDDAKDGQFTTLINQIFGKINPDKSSESGRAFFSNATILEQERQAIIKNNYSALLYRYMASTAMEESGVAKKKSLRVMEVCVPLSLAGYIGQITSEEQVNLIEMAFKWTRHLGASRNRGLGRCQFSLIKKEGQ